MKREGILFCLVGPAGGGKTTIAQKLLEHMPSSMKLSVSVTSRPIRPGEIEGKSYYFVTRNEFEKKIKQGEFFEWEEVHGNLYGTLRCTLRDTIAQGTDLLLDIDIRGATTLKIGYPQHTVSIFLLPPSPETLIHRLNARGTDEPDALEARMHTASGEYQKLLEQRGTQLGIDYLVVNDNLGSTVNTMCAILTAERVRLSRLSVDELKNLCKVPKI